jgi:uncharacterized protein
LVDGNNRYGVLPDRILKSKQYLSKPTPAPMQKPATLLFCLIAVAAYGQTYTVETVPNTKLINNSYVSNPDGILSESAVQQINTGLDSLEKKTTAQVAVVLLSSIGDADIKDFSQQLFVTWGIGQAGNNNGLLILFVLDKRTVRFHTGYGIEGVLPDAVCKEIQRVNMVPFFREQNYDAGMIAGVQQVITILTDPAAAEEIRNTTDNTSSISWYDVLLGAVVLSMVVAFVVAHTKKKFQSESGLLVLRIPLLWWIFLYPLLSILLIQIADYFSFSFIQFLILTYCYLIFLLLEKYFRMQFLSANHIKNEKFLDLFNFYNARKNKWILPAILFPVPMLLVYVLMRRKTQSFRDHPRTCKKCKQIISAKLSEQAEDEYLKAGQITEEKIGTIDYDVWKCQSCGSVEILNYPTASSKYSSCPTCGFLTYHFGAKRTIQSATYENDGYGETERTCLHCGHNHIDKFIIAMLVASSSSDSDSSSSSSDSGSWGGGDSGGGGSDSSW